MFHFPPLAPTDLCIQSAVLGYCPSGFPHSEIPGSKPVCGSPRLIAAYHVLHRLLVPRHPPCALSNLAEILQGARLFGKTVMKVIQLSKNQAEPQLRKAYATQLRRIPLEMLPGLIRTGRGDASWWR